MEEERIGVRGQSKVGRSYWKERMERNLCSGCKITIIKTKQPKLKTKPNFIVRYEIPLQALLVIKAPKWFRVFSFLCIAYQHQSITCCGGRHNKYIMLELSWKLPPCRLIFPQMERYCLSCWGWKILSLEPYRLLLPTSRRDVLLYNSICGQQMSIHP